MKDRYEVDWTSNGAHADDMTFWIVDNLTGESVGDRMYSEKEHEIAKEKCQQLNTEDHQKRKSAQIMKVAGIGGYDVDMNLCNEFNFSDLWEVVEWVVNHEEEFGQFEEFWVSSDLYMMKQHEMQTAIVDEIHDLMTKCGMIASWKS